MANKRISELTAYTTPISGDVLPINDTTNTTTKKVTVDNLFNVLSSLFRIKDSSDTTKKVAFDVSGVTTATTRTLTVPNANTTIVGTDATQTLSAKTLTSPKITVGSDAAGDIHYTSNADGTQSRLAIGTNNYILRSNGSAPTWSAETTNANASTTVAGVVELATSSEVTSGTATGGTGAALAVTPDGLAASTPVFNGSGLTNIPRWLTSGAPNTTTTNTTATVLTYSLTGGTLSTNKGVRIRIAVQVAITASNASAVYTVQYGGSTIGSFGYDGSSGTPTVTAVSVIDITLLGSGATGTQRANAINTTAITSGSGGVSSGQEAQVYSTSIDSTANQNITISCTSGSSSVTGTLLDYFIEKVQ